MPVITVQMHETSSEQKADLIHSLTAAAVEVTRIPAPMFIVLIQELKDQNIGIGGKTRAEVMATR